MSSSAEKKNTKWPLLCLWNPQVALPTLLLCILKRINHSKQSCLRKSKPSCHPSCLRLTYYSMDSVDRRRTKSTLHSWTSMITISLNNQLLRSAKANSPWLNSDWSPTTQPAIITIIILLQHQLHHRSLNDSAPSSPMTKTTMKVSMNTCLYVKKISKLWMNHFRCLLRNVDLKSPWVSLILMLKPSVKRLMKQVKALKSLACYQVHCKSLSTAMIQTLNHKWFPSTVSSCFPVKMWKNVWWCLNVLLQNAPWSSKVCYLWVISHNTMQVSFRKSNWTLNERFEY